MAAVPSQTEWDETALIPPIVAIISKKRLQNLFQQFGQAPAGFVQFIADYLR